MKQNSEPIEAFPYLPPSQDIREKYKEIFELKHSVKIPLTKLIFDKLVSSIILLLCLPVIFFLFIFNFFEGLIIPENRGPLFFIIME